MEIPRSAARELTSVAGSADCDGFGRRDCDVCDVAWAQAEGKRTTGAVDNGMDLGGSPAAGATDRPARACCRARFGPSSAEGNHTTATYKARR
jgi:hypothetical protein